MPHIVKSVAKWMNITLSFIKEPEDNYGSWVNNTWNGMVGMLYRNEVDLILNPIMPKDKILEFAYFTNPVTVDAYTILSGKESVDPYDLSSNYNRPDVYCNIQKCDQA
ncbi:lig_chan-Glu_bd domain-containing protein [Caerostris darwini]|uniref:Lig_chan-Glu_bd domain-containing protein n=1 Tax=Caerostris darwini TaxID=1538125 RepID=A0AAV4WZ29_9ARAC|nr:lig_chan-Glu_bd domain-containing protein [Caerostris darwini]